MDGPSAPLAAADRALLGAPAPLLHRYVDILTSRGIERGLLGPREAPRVWERHVLNCAAIAPLLPHNVAVVDIGSGAGLPGVVLAVLRPDVAVTLVEPLLRRSDFLHEVVAELGLANATVDRERAEERASRRSAGPLADVVTARAVAPLARLLSWAVPLVRPGGEILLIKGASAQAEIAAAAPALARLPVGPARVERVGGWTSAPPTTVVRFTLQSGDRARRPVKGGRA